MDESGDGARTLGAGPLTPADLGLDDAIAEFERRAAQRGTGAGRSWKGPVVAALVLVLFASLITYDFVLHDGLGGGLLDSATPHGVYDACNRFVADRLQLPRSTSFATMEASLITVDGAYGTDVSSVGVPQPSGTKNIVPFTCEVGYAGNGSWKLTSLDLHRASTAAG